MKKSLSLLALAILASGLVRPLEGRVPLADLERQLNESKEIIRMSAAYKKNLDDLVGVFGRIPEAAKSETNEKVLSEVNELKRRLDVLNRNVTDAMIPEIEKIIKDSFVLPHFKEEEEDYREGQEVRITLEELGGFSKSYDGIKEAATATWEKWKPSALTDFDDKVTELTRVINSIEKCIEDINTFYRLHARDLDAENLSVLDMAQRSVENIQRCVTDSLGRLPPGFEEKHWRDFFETSIKAIDAKITKVKAVSTPPSSTSSPRPPAAAERGRLATAERERKAAAESAERERLAAERYKMSQALSAAAERGVSAESSSTSSASAAPSTSPTAVVDYLKENKLSSLTVFSEDKFGNDLLKKLTLAKNTAHIIAARADVLATVKKWFESGIKKYEGTFLYPTLLRKYNEFKVATGLSGRP